MIYDYPPPHDPIRQGDIFFRIPCVELPTEQVPVVSEDSQVQVMTWQEFVRSQTEVTALIAVRPVTAIVGSQNCDAVRDRDITLFEIKDFREVEGMCKDTKSSKSWVKIITKHSRINQKWFYLPPDKKLGFLERMGVDFRGAFRMPRETLESLRSQRGGHLKRVAEEHFRERLAQFFRRYPYDEWYPLDKEEFNWYRGDQNDPLVTPFPWQAE